MSRELTEEDMDGSQRLFDVGTTVVPHGGADRLPAWARSLWPEVASAAGIVADMDAQGVGVRCLRAVRLGPEGRHGSAWIDRGSVAELVAAEPSRLMGVWGYAPEEGWRGCVALEDAVTSGGFVAAHVAPAWFGLHPDDRRLYPLYAKCAELDIPVQIEVGSRRLREGQPRLPAHGRPQSLDEIACDFPSLRMIAVGTGWPWTTEMVAVANKHEGISVAAEGADPQQWDTAMRDFARAWGRSKMMLSLDGADVGAVVRIVSSLGLPDESVARILWGNAQSAMSRPLAG